MRGCSRPVAPAALSICAIGRSFLSPSRRVAAGDPRWRVSACLISSTRARLGQRRDPPALFGDPLGRTKTADADSDESVYIIGRPVVVLKQWLALAGIQGGPVFRSIDRFGRLGKGPLDGQSINAILKKRCAKAGLAPVSFSAHGLRSGYLTEAARQGVPLQEAMAQSRHRSVQQAADYYNGVAIEQGLAARLGSFEQPIR